MRRLSAISFLAAGRRLGLAPALLILSSCGAGNSSSSGGPDKPIVPPTPIEYLEVTPGSARMSVEDTTTTFIARLVRSDGVQNVTPVTWTSSDSTIAEIDSDGVAHGKQWGTIMVTATTPSHTATASLTVGEPVILGISGFESSLTVFPVDGGSSRTFDFHGTFGFAPVRDGLCYIHFTFAAGPVLELWFTNLVDPPVLVAPFPAGPFHDVRGMVSDSLGRVYILTEPTWILRYDPAEPGVLSPFVPAPGDLIIALAVDDSDNLYLQDGMPAGNWIYRISPDTGETISAATFPVPDGYPHAGGVAVTGDGKVMFIADDHFDGIAGGGTGYIYRCEDLEGDGIFTTPEPCSSHFPIDFGQRLWGILWKGDGLLVNDLWGTLWLLKDGNNDKDFMDDGEQTVWAGTIGRPTTNTYTVLARSLSSSP